MVVEDSLGDIAGFEVGVAEVIKEFTAEVSCIGNSLIGLHSLIIFGIDVTQIGIFPLVSKEV